MTKKKGKKQEGKRVGIEMEKWKGQVMCSAQEVADKAMGSGRSSALRCYNVDYDLFDLLFFSSSKLQTITVISIL